MSTIFIPLHFRKNRSIFIQIFLRSIQDPAVCGCDDRYQVLGVFESKCYYCAYRIGSCDRFSDNKSHFLRLSRRRGRIGQKRIKVNIAGSIGECGCVLKRYSNNWLFSLILNACVELTVVSAMVAKKTPAQL